MPHNKYRAHVLSILDEGVDPQVLWNTWDEDAELTLVENDPLAWAKAYAACAGEIGVPHLIVFAGLKARSFPATISILRDIKGQPQLAAVPVVVLSELLDPASVIAYYAEHASCVIEIPGTLEGFESILQEVKRFWLGVARLPNKDSDE